MVARLRPRNIAQSGRTVRAWELVAATPGVWETRLRHATGSSDLGDVDAAEQDDNRGNVLVKGVSSHGARG